MEDAPSRPLPLRVEFFPRVRDCNFFLPRRGSPLEPLVGNHAAQLFRLPRSAPRKVCGRIVRGCASLVGSALRPKITLPHDASRTTELRSISAYRRGGDGGVPSCAGRRPGTLSRHPEAPPEIETQRPRTRSATGFVALARLPSTARKVRSRGGRETSVAAPRVPSASRPRSPTGG